MNIFRFLIFKVLYVLLVSFLRTIWSQAQSRTGHAKSFFLEVS